MKTLFGAIIFIVVFCAAAYAELQELPPLEDISSLSYEELLAKAAEYPGLEYLKENATFSAFATDSQRIHPNIIHDAFLLTVSLFDLP